MFSKMHVTAHKRNKRESVTANGEVNSKLFRVKHFADYATIKNHSKNPSKQKKKKQKFTSKIV